MSQESLFPAEPDPDRLVAWIEEILDAEEMNPQEWERFIVGRILNDVVPRWEGREGEYVQ